MWLWNLVPEAYPLLAYHCFTGWPCLGDVQGKCDCRCRTGVRVSCGEGPIDVCTIWDVCTYWTAVWITIWNLAVTKRDLCHCLLQKMLCNSCISFPDSVIGIHWNYYEDRQYEVAGFAKPPECCNAWFDLQWRYTFVIISDKWCYSAKSACW